MLVNTNNISKEKFERGDSVVLIDSDRNRNMDTVKMGPIYIVSDVREISRRIFDDVKVRPILSLEGIPGRWFDSYRFTHPVTYRRQKIENIISRIDQGHKTV